eukprot:6515291-Prymnesium_polylepis.1
MDLAQRGAANSSPRAAKRDSISRFILALAAALGICAMSGLLAGRSGILTPDRYRSAAHCETSPWATLRAYK